MDTSSSQSTPHSDVDTIWRDPPQDLNLPSDAVHVWRASLSLSDVQQQSLRHLLSDDERQRIDQALSETVRNRFLAARGMLRVLLGRYLDIAPERLCFGYNEYGKPCLIEPEKKASLTFNISHSGDLGVFAVTWNRDIGVDVEFQKPGSPDDRMQIARRFFSDTEYETLTMIPELRRQDAFYRCWTRKEAFIKAKGVGMSLSLSAFDVSVQPESPPALLATRWDPAEADRWSLYALEPGTGYAGALAVEGTDLQIACWQLTP